jgi:hypothetical protein
MKVKLPFFECLRCGHRWAPKKEEKPLRCAYCKSPYWEKAPNQESVMAGKHHDGCVECRDRK